MVRWLRRFHLLMVLVWVTLAVPGLLWWSQSVPFLVIMSLYANVAGELAAYQGARTETKQDEARK